MSPIGPSTITFVRWWPTGVALVLDEGGADVAKTAQALDYALAHVSHVIHDVVGEEFVKAVELAAIDQMPVQGQELMNGDQITTE